MGGIYASNLEGLSGATMYRCGRGAGHPGESGFMCDADVDILKIFNDKDTPKMRLICYILSLVVLICLV